MNYEWLIAKRILRKPARHALASGLAGGEGQKRNSTRPIIRITITGIIISMAVMIAAIAVVTGFQKEIREKISGFGAHIQITSYDMNNSFESSPISIRQPFYPLLEKVDGIRHIQVFATKAGIIKTGTEIQSVLLKGVGSDYDWDFFKDKIITGKVLSLNDTVKSDEVLISQKIAEKLKLKVGDTFIMHFIQQPPRFRKFTIAGIYLTGLEEFDNLFVFGDINHIRKLNDWSDDKVGGFEVLVNDFNKLDEIGQKVYASIGPELNARTIKEVYPQVFDWLKLQDVNALIIIVLMVVVAGINMISALLIIMLERTNMIGMLKSMGTSNGSLRKIFVYTAARLIGKGMLWGNIIGIGICLIQKYGKIIGLNQESYYISYVPVHISIPDILLLNAGTFIVCTAMMLLPTMILSGITPVKAIRFR